MVIKNVMTSFRFTETLTRKSVQTVRLRPCVKTPINNINEKRGEFQAEVRASKRFGLMFVDQTKP